MVRDCDDNNVSSDDALSLESFERQPIRECRDRSGRRLSLTDRIALVRLWYRYNGDMHRILYAWRTADANANDANVNDENANNEAEENEEYNQNNEMRGNNGNNVNNDNNDNPRRSINGRTVRATIHRFQELGTVKDRPRSGRRRSARTVPMIERVRESVLSDPMLSTRKRARALNISRSSLMRIQRLDLHVRPYKVQLVHKMLPVDTQQRLDLCERLLRLDGRDDTFVHRLIMGDEAHFDLSGAVFNRQNVRFWGTENPRLWRPRPLHTVRVTVWCGVSSVGILGPYFFESPNGAALSVTGARYRRMLLTYIEPLLRKNPRYKAIRDWWWQQDGATAHTARESLVILRRIFGVRRIISRGTQFPWPARSPDLSPPDYFLWGYLKDRVYRTEDDMLVLTEDARVTPRTIVELKMAIIREINALNDSSNDHLRRSVMTGLIERARACLRGEGQHLLDVIFHT